MCRRRRRPRATSPSSDLLHVLGRVVAVRADRSDPALGQIATDRGGIAFGPRAEPPAALGLDDHAVAPTEGVGENLAAELGLDPVADDRDARCRAGFAPVSTGRRKLHAVELRRELAVLQDLQHAANAEAAAMSSRAAGVGTQLV